VASGANTASSASDQITAAIAEAMVELAPAFTGVPPEQVAALVSEAISDLVAPDDGS
jgi:hypothetical protein